MVWWALSKLYTRKATFRNGLAKFPKGETVMDKNITKSKKLFWMTWNEIDSDSWHSKISNECEGYFAHQNLEYEIPAQSG